MRRALSITLRNKEAFRVDYSQHVQLISRTPESVMLSVFNELAWENSIIEIPTPAKGEQSPFLIPLSQGQSVEAFLTLHGTRSNAVSVSIPEAAGVDLLFSRQYKDKYRRFI